MKIVLSVILFFSSLNLVSAVNKAVYGEDNRLNVFEINDPRLVEFASSTAVMILGQGLKKRGDYFELIDYKTLDERIPLCFEEPFGKEISVGECSGFLVAPDVLVTAGHCIKNKYDCKKAKWVFDFSIKFPGEDLSMIPEENVYGCSKVLDRELNGQTGMDFAIIRLSKRVIKRLPLRIRTSGSIKKKTPLVLIGNPIGIPTKVSTDAMVYNIHDKLFFVADTDSFQGSSGSAVFNYDTGLVEGILIRGEQDYIRDEQRKCIKFNRCNSIDDCRGEDILRITKLKDLQKYL
ncbi:MAG: trypsin-like peptidase domain-containing protein [Bacteriovoracaceae bacterium]|nr:trypsin-like peptidase domain-containing protein [Bacteriovoracaceae bacterium]